MRLSFEPNVRPTCRPYTKLVVCERFLNVQTSKQRGKNVSWSRVPAWWRRPPPMVQLAQWLIWHCLRAFFSVSLCENTHICTLIQLWYSLLRGIFAFAEHTPYARCYSHTHVIYHQSADIAWPTSLWRDWSVSLRYLLAVEPLTCLQSRAVDTPQ